MRPLDPRLLRTARAARWWVVLAAALQAGAAALIVVQAWFLAEAVATVVAGGTARAAVRPVLIVAAAFAGRAALAALTERFGLQAGIAVIGQLRQAALDHVRAVGPAALRRRTPADLATLLTTGLDQLDGYLVHYLPQLLGTALVTPALVLVVWLIDPVSAYLMIGTIPLVPLFMALVGWTTQTLSERRLAQMRRLGDQVLDLVAGLPTLTALGRAAAQTAQVHRTGEAYRRSTTQVLGIAFMSGFVLEFLTTLSVALVAVGIGMRLVHGDMALHDGLAVLILAPEVYLPLRMVGQYYHASTDGLAAIASVFEVLDETGTRTEGTRQPAAAPRVLAWDEVTVTHPGRDVAAPYALTGRAEAGRITALVGPNGAGKSTAAAALLGLVPVDEGTVSVDGVPVPQLERAAWHRRVAWLPQHPMLVPGSLTDNLEVLLGPVSGEERDAAARAAGLSQVVADLPDGWGTRIGTGGVGLSAGQRQRLALTRSLIAVQRGAGVVVLDEPSAHLDAGTEEFVLGCLRRWAADGLVVLVVAHRPELIAVADHVVQVRARELAGAGQVAR